LIGIGSADIYIDTPSLSREKLEEYSRSLFSQWEIYVDEHLELSDYSLSLSIEEGSVKALGKIGVTLYALYLGIGNYSSFVSGIQTIQKQVTDISEYLGQQAVLPFSDNQITPKLRKRGEALSKLEGIFKKVEAGKLTVEEAMQASKKLLGDEESFPEFYENLEDSLNEIPPHPSESQLELDVTLAHSEAMIVSESIKSSSKPSIPKKPKQPAVDYYRVDVWRESRKKGIHVKVTKV